VFLAGKLRAVHGEDADEESHGRCEQTQKLISTKTHPKKDKKKKNKIKCYASTFFKS